MFMKQSETLNSASISELPLPHSNSYREGSEIRVLQDLLNKNERNIDDQKS